MLHVPEDIKIKNSAGGNVEKKKFNVRPNLLKIKFDCFHLSSVFTDYDDDNEINRTKR